MMASKTEVGWHICSVCQKSAHYMCYTCTYSLCKGCTKDADYLSVRGDKGFCMTCMRTVMLIENKEQGNKEMVELKEGPLDQFKHEMEPFLCKQGMSVRLNKGVVELVSDFVVCEKGNPLSPESARILRLLEIKAAFRLHLVCITIFMFRAIASLRLLVSFCLIASNFSKFVLSFLSGLQKNSERTRMLQTSAACVHLKHLDVSKHTRNLSPPSRAILLSGPAELYQQMLAKAVSHYFEAKLLLLEVTCLFYEGDYNKFYSLWSSVIDK